MKKTVVILAAGMGSRYGGLKQLDRVGPSGETIIDYSLFDAVRAGFKKVVFVIREDIADEFRARIGARFEDRIEVAYVFQKLEDIPEGFTLPEDRKKPWGTGHAMLTAASEVQDPFIVLNADDFYGRDAFERASRYMDSMNLELGAALVGFRLDNTLSEHGSVARGVCSIAGNNTLLDVEEILGIHRDESGALLSDNRKDLAGSDIVSMNMWIFSPDILKITREYFQIFLIENRKDSKAEFYIPLVVSGLIRDRNIEVTALSTESVWHGVTYKADKPSVVKSLAAYTARGEYPENLFS